MSHERAIWGRVRQARWMLDPREGPSRVRCRLRRVPEHFGASTTLAALGSTGTGAGVGVGGAGAGAGASAGVGGGSADANVANDALVLNEISTPDAAVCASASAGAKVEGGVPTVPPSPSIVLRSASTNETSPDSLEPLYSMTDVDESEVR